MAKVASSVMHKVLGRWAVDVDKPHHRTTLSASSLTRTSTLASMALLRPLVISLLMPAPSRTTNKADWYILAIWDLDSLPALKSHGMPLLHQHSTHCFA